MVSQIVAIFDAKTSTAKNMIKRARAEQPHKVLTATRGRKANSVIVLLGDRYVISTIHRQQLASRLGLTKTKDEVEIPVLRSRGKNLKKAVREELVEES